MRWIAVLALLLLAACSGSESQVAPEPTAITDAQPTAAAAAPTDTLPPPVVTEAPTETAAAPLPIDPSPTAAPTEALATATSEPVLVDGPYEQTFFRGRADAPLTMIDYSDFL